MCDHKWTCPMVEELNGAGSALSREVLNQPEPWLEETRVDCFCRVRRRVVSMLSLCLWMSDCRYKVIWKALQVWSSVVKVVSEKEKCHGGVIRQDLPAVNPTFKGEGSPTADVPHRTDSHSEPHWPYKSCRWHESPSQHFPPFAHRQRLHCYLLSCIPREREQQCRCIL